MAAKAKESLKLKEEKALLKTKLVSKKKQEKEIAKLSLKLAKEKEWLATLRGRFKEASKSHEAKEAAREKKLLSKILKQYRKLNSYAYFIKTQKGQTLIQSKEKWLALSEYEKEDLQDQTDAYNEQQLKIYKPKPKKPATGFALYVKENFVSDGRSVVEINKDLSKQWNSLNEHQKGEYKIGQDVKDEYKRALDAWVENRIDIYKSSVSSV